MMGYLLRSVNILNVSLVAAAIVAGYFTIQPLLHARTGYRPIQPPGAASAKAGDENPVQVEQSATQAALDYTMIADNNLFHPERRIPVEKAEAKPLPKPEFVLYGILTTDDQEFVYIEDKKFPLSTPGRGKRLSVLKIGDTLSGFTLKGIEPDNAIMVRGKETIVVSLNESKSKTRGQPDKTGQPNTPVMQARPGSAQAPQPYVSQPPPQPQTPQRVPQPQPPPKPPQPPGVPAG